MSVFDPMFQAMDRLHPLPDSLKKEIENRAIFREIPRNHHLLRPEQVSRETFFILKGCVRYYYEKEGKDITGFFFFENMFGGSVESFYTQTPSLQGLESLEATELVVLTYDAINHFLETSFEFNCFVRKLSLERLAFSQKVIASYILDKPEERYLKLMQAQPQILQRVPQHVLSSFLGITPVSLSRIRKRVLGKDK